MRINSIRSSAFGIAAAFLAISGYATAQATPRNMQLVSANARLVHQLDSKDATQGQIVTAQLTGNVKTADGMELPRGTLLMGKVDHVQTSTKDGPSRLSIVFNQARLKDGHTIRVKATLLGAYPSDLGSYYADTGDNGSVLNTEPHFIAADQKVDQEPGLLGGNIAMHSAVQSHASAVFVSKDRNIDLRSGTQFQLAIAPATSSMG
jgi:hypothetical protein